jgi:DNA mismatch endonuclease (patch repair protein)
MTDHLSKKQRSANMRAVRSRNTRPEVRVRQILHRLGCRFRLHQNDRPGKPDISLRRLQKAIYVHGCFWHQHKGCRRATIPQSNRSFWLKKLRRNAVRDSEQLALIRKRGWRVLIVWECELKREQRLQARLERFLAR